MARSAGMMRAASSCGDAATAGGALSRAVVAAGAGAASRAEFPALLMGRPFDPLAYRRCFPDRWPAFLRAHFRSHVEVAVFFSVGDRTARDWWEGVSTGQAWAVGYAVATIPGAAGQLAEAA